MHAHGHSHAPITFGRAFALGVTLNLGFVILETIYGHTAKQDVVKTADHATGWQIPVLALAIVLLAPVTEELLFRGLLLRALLRRTTPVWAVVISSVVFAAAHLLDPHTVTLMAPLLLLATISAIRAVRSGELSQSILLHAGFNLLSAILLVTT